MESTDLTFNDRTMTFGTERQPLHANMLELNGERYFLTTSHA